MGEDQSAFGVSSIAPLDDYKTGAPEDDYKSGAPEDDFRLSMRSSADDMNLGRSWDNFVKS